MKTEKVLAPIELNLMEHPFFYPAAGRQGGERPTVWRVRLGKDAYVEITNGFGIPGPFEADVMIGLLVLWHRKGRPQKLYFSLHELCEVLGMKRETSKVKEALKRLSATSFWFVQTFYDGSSYETMPDARFLRELAIYEEKSSKNPKKLANRETYVVIDQWVLDQIEKKLFRYVDFERHRSLRSGIAKRLHLYLLRHLGDQQKFQIRFSSLAERIPLETYTKYKLKKQAMRILLSALSELQAKGIVAYEYYALGRDYVFVFESVYERRLRMLREVIGTVLEEMGLDASEQAAALEKDNIEKTAVILWEIERQRPLDCRVFFVQAAHRPVRLTARARREIERLVSQTLAAAVERQRIQGLEETWLLDVLESLRAKLRLLTAADLYCVMHLAKTSAWEKLRRYCS